MRKQDVVNAVAEKTGIAKADVLVAIEGFITEVKNSVANGEPVFLRGFGSFQPKLRKQKIARHVRANTEIVLPPHFIPFFKPADEFKEEVKKLEVDSI